MTQRHVAYDPYCMVCGFQPNVDPETDPDAADQEHTAYDPAHMAEWSTEDPSEHGPIVL